MTDLDKLIAAVEAGDEIACDDACRTMHRTKRDNGEHWPGYDAMKAFGGSLDAALRLHEALLSGWDFSVRKEGAAVYFYIDREEPKYRGKWCQASALASGDCPARSWLLAILRAVKAQGERG